MVKRLAISNQQAAYKTSATVTDTADSRKRSDLKADSE